MKDMHGGSTINVDVKLATTTTATASTPAPTNDTGEEGRQDKVKKQRKKSSVRHSGTAAPRSIQRRRERDPGNCANFVPISRNSEGRLRATRDRPRLQVTAVRHAGVAAAAAARVFDPSVGRSGKSVGAAAAAPANHGKTTQPTQRCRRDVRRAAASILYALTYALSQHLLPVVHSAVK